MKKITCQGNNSLFCYFTHQGFIFLSGTLMSFLLVLSLTALWYNSSIVKTQSYNYLAFIDELD